MSRLVLKEALPIQVQLAASLGHTASLDAALPKLNLRLHWLQWLMCAHRTMPTDLRRVLRSATRSSELRIPPRLLGEWAADCAERALPAFESLLPDDHRPRLAIAAVRAWVRRAPSTPSQASNAANEAISRARTASEAKSLTARQGAPLKGWVYDAEAAAYSAREAAAAPGEWANQPDCPRWMISDHAGVRAGHAAAWAAHAAPAREAEFAWQRERLIELLLGWNPNDWGDL